MWTEKFNRQYKEKIKKLTINFADIKKGETMLVSSPVSIAKYIKKIPKGKKKTVNEMREALAKNCLLYTSPSPRDATLSRMPSSA